MMKKKEELEWRQLSNSFPINIPIYAIGTIGWTQSTTAARIGFSTNIPQYINTPLSTTDPNGLHARIYMGGSSEGNMRFYYFLNGTYSHSEWKTYSQASFEQKSITLGDGSVVNNVWVYENADINKISSYDVEGQQNGAQPVYFCLYQAYATTNRMYVLVPKDM